MRNGGPLQKTGRTLGLGAEGLGVAGFLKATRLPPQIPQVPHLLTLDPIDGTWSWWPLPEHGRLSGT